VTAPEPAGDGVDLGLGLRIGHATDLDAATGLTVFLPPDGAVVAAEVWGQNAGTMNVSGLGPHGASDGLDAIALSGGSTFGLGSATELVAELERRGVGYQVVDRVLPAVAAAIIFDLQIGRAAAPAPGSAAVALDAAVPAGTEALGTVGAATGATVGDVDGPSSATKGGFGRAHRRTAQGPLVAAWAVVNAFGDVLDDTGMVLAGMRRQGEFAGVVDVLATDPDPLLVWGRATTLVVVATDAALTKSQAARLARAGGAGMAQAISPTGTGLDGDTAFAIATGTVPPKSILGLEAVAASVVADAVRCGVRTATGLHGVPSSRDLGLR
jgi:L-aminopeptidase/D-esterase-like protein